MAIVDSWNTRYDPRMDPADIERRLDAGDWLTPGEVAALLGRGYSRTSVHRLLTAGRIGYRLTGGTERPVRLCDPADVRVLLEESRTVHRAPPT